MPSFIAIRMVGRAKRTTCLSSVRQSLSAGSSSEGLMLSDRGPDPQDQLFLRAFRLGSFEQGDHLFLDLFVGELVPRVVHGEAFLFLAIGTEEEDGRNRVDVELVE